MWGYNIIFLVLSINFMIYSTKGVNHSLELYNHQNENVSTYQIKTSETYSMIDAWSHFEKYFPDYGPKRICHVGTYVCYLLTPLNRLIQIVSSKSRVCFTIADNATTLTRARYDKVGPADITQIGVGFTTMPGSNDGDYPVTIYTEDIPAYNETNVHRIWLFGDTPLTIYSNTNYTGFSMCLQPISPEPVLPVFIGYFMDSLGLEMDAIKSFKFGCF